MPRFLTTLRFALLSALGLALIGFHTQTAPTWADPLGVPEEEATEPEKEKPKRLTKAERRAKKAAEKKQKERDRVITNMEKRLGKKKDGYFVLVFKTTKFLNTSKYNAGADFMPTPYFSVVVEDGRRAAAEKIVTFLLDIERQKPKKAGASRTPPPKGEFKLIARYDDRIEADDRRTAAERDCEKIARAQIKKMEQRRKKKTTLNGNPL